MIGEHSMKRLRSSLLALLCCSASSALAADGDSITSKVTTLETTTAVSVTTDRAISLDGVLEAVNQSTVAAQTSGRVEEVFFDVGDYVEAGKVIVRLSNTEQQARLSSAQASVSEAQARLAEAQLNYNRTREIFDRGLVAKAALDTAAANLRSAQARVAAAEASTREAREGTAYTEIKAPYGGYVVKRHIEVGETATVGTPLMTGLSLDPLRAVVEVPQAYITALREHHRARVQLPDGRSVEATDLRLPPNADPATHTFRVLVTLPSGDHGVFPGSLVKVSFTSGAEQQVLVPPTTIVRRSEVNGVYVVDAEGRVGFRYVRVGTPTASGDVPVLAGLTAEERVALDPIAAGILYKQQNQPSRDSANE
jgi:RND family efflux transporter MFP subunit